MMSRWKYHPRQVWIGWTVGFAALALLSFIGGIYWLGAACIVGAALCAGQTLRVWNRS